MSFALQPMLGKPLVPVKKVVAPVKKVVALVVKKVTLPVVKPVVVPPVKKVVAPVVKSLLVGYSAYTRGQLDQVKAVLNTKAYKVNTGLTFAGFTVADVADYLFASAGTSTKVQQAQAESLIRAQLGLKQTDYTQVAFGLIDKRRLNASAGTNSIPWLFQHMAEHSKGSHYSGDLGKVIANVGRGFTALFTVGLSEIPIGDDRLGKITRVEPIISSNLSGGIFTTGSENKLEKTIIGTVFKVGSAVAGISAASAGTTASLSGALDSVVTPAVNTGARAGVSLATASTDAAPSILSKSIGYATLGAKSVANQIGGNFLQKLIAPLTKGADGLVSQVLGQPAKLNVSGGPLTPVGMPVNWSGSGATPTTQTQAGLSSNTGLLLAGGGILLVLGFLLMRK